MKRVSALIATRKPATRRSPRRLIRGSMATRSIDRCILCVLVTCALQGALSGGVARAEAPRLVPNGNFGFKSGLALGVAVDGSTSDVYVGSLLGSSFSIPGRVEKFDAAGALLAPSPFGEGYNSGMAVNPVNGDVYVLREAGFFQPTAIETYDPNSGALLSSFAVPRSGNISGAFTVVQIAADSAGNVYVPSVPGDQVLEYSPSGTLLQTFTGAGAGALKAPTGVAVDSSGNLWVADAGDNRIEELSSAGAFLDEIKSEGVAAVALDGHGDVFAIVRNGADFCGSIETPCSHLVEYGSTGVQLADLGAGLFGTSGGFNLPGMVAVDEASGRVYVTDGPKHLVWIFQPPVAPTLGMESAVEVGTVEAKLGVLVDPGGAQTTYRFEYDTRAYIEGEAPHGASVPFPEGNAGEAFSSHVVWGSAKSLAPGTTYHYRAIATNAFGTVVGPDETFTTETAAQASCPNEDARSGYSAELPDCRAYELVTPASKASPQPDTGHIEEGIFHGNRAADDGNRYTYQSLEVMPGAQSAGLEFVSTRGPGGWTTQDALPLEPYTGDRCTLKEEDVLLQYSADLSKSIILTNYNYGNTFPNACRAEVVEAAPGEPLFEENLVLSNHEDGTYQLINVTPPGVTPTPASLVAASADLSLVIFAERAKLTPDAQNNTVNVYEWSKGVVHLFKLVLPSGTPVAGSLVSISADGSEVFFSAGGKLYVQRRGQHTVQLNEARGGSGPGGGGAFTSVTSDGSQVFFSDDAAAGLTSDTVPGSGTNLYRYDMNTGQLTDLAPVSEAKAGFSYIGEDGSYVYYTSPAVLTGSQTNQFGEEAETGKENLYLDHNGTIAFVMHGGGGVFSANGAYFAYELHGEKYLYSAAAGRSVEAGGVTLGYEAGARHWVSNNGQVFFETAEALLPRDTNGVADVYEFGFSTGLHLISTGTSSYESLLLPASTSGNDVFFLTHQNLVPQDNFQEAAKIYDARVDGGFPESASPPACTNADACRSAATPQPSIYGAPSSQTFSGAGNLVPQAEVEAKKKSKPKRKRAQRACTRNRHGRARCIRQANGKATSHHKGGK